MAGSVYNIKNARTGNIEYTHIYAYEVPLGIIFIRLYVSIFTNMYYTHAI